MLINESVKETREKIFKECPDLMKFKKNPKNYPIINKYNRRIFNSNKHKIFSILDKAIDEFVGDYCEDEMRTFCEKGDIIKNYEYNKN